MIRPTLLALLALSTGAGAEPAKCITYAHVVKTAPFQKDVTAVIDLFLPLDDGSVKRQRYNDGSAAMFYFDAKGCMYFARGVSRYDIEPLIRKFGGAQI